MSTTAWIVVAVLAVAVIVVGLLIARRMRYVRSLRGRGWRFESSPALETVLDHHAPPFGLGFRRKADELVAGTTGSGLPFRVFEYECSAGGPDFDARLASLRLPVALPDLFVTAGSQRAGVADPAVDIQSGLTVNAADSGYARAALGGGALGAVAAFGQGAGQGRVDLSVDGDNLVAIGAPKDPDELAAYLEALAPVASAIASSAAAFAVPATSPGFGFYRRPDWVLIGEDDSAIDRYGLTRTGSNHRTENLVRAANDGLPFEAFVHRWQTTRTETYTDAQGRTQTRTVTEQHDETVLVITMPFALPLLAVGGGAGGGGERVRFESEDFNDAFKVRAGNPKFASDVIHPRQMEYLMAVKPPSFRIEGPLFRFFPGEHDTMIIGECADVAHGFLGRVPSFVWKDLQITPPAFRV